MKTVCGNNCGNASKCGCSSQINDCKSKPMCGNATWPIYALSKNGQEFYPLTHTKAIVTDDCQTLDDKFKEIDSKINTQILDVNVNLSNDEPVSLDIDDDGICRLNPTWLASQHKAIRLISEEQSLNQVIVYMDRADIVPILNREGNFTYNSARQIVAVTYWRFVYGGYEYVIDSTCKATVHKAAEGGSETGGEVVREDIDGNQKLYVTPLGKAVMPLVTDTDSGLMRAIDYKKLKILIGILESHDPINHTIIINGIKYKLTPWTDAFLWTNDQNWNEGNKWE